MLEYGLIATSVFVGILLMALPQLARRNIFFSVAVPEGFRQSDEAQRRLWSYRLAVGAATVLGVLLMTLAPAPGRYMAVGFYPLVLIVVSGIAYFAHYRALRGIAVQAHPVEEQDAPASMPAWSLFMIGPFLLLIAAAWYLQTHWDQIPTRFPVHWGADGVANRWAERTVKGVFGPLVFGGTLCAWFTVMALAGWFGVRRSRSRTLMLGVMVAVQYLLGTLFAVVSLMPILHIPVWVIVLVPLAFLVPVVVIFAREWASAEGGADTTPNECWKAGMIYYNPADPAIFVEKRFGLGYTMNFANPWSWVLMASLLATVATGPFVLV